MSATKPSHIIGIVGVRDYNGSVYENYEYIAKTLEDHISRHTTPADFGVLTGGGRGVESLVVRWAESKGIWLRKIPPNINQFGPKKAFTVRNNNIVAESNDVVFFWDGYTDVTTEAIMSAMHLQKRATVFPLI
jgi:hypothetical protein